MPTAIRLCSFLFATLLGGVTALALPQDIVEQVKKVTALVEVPVSAEEKGFGTAFCIDAKGVFVTNAHVVEGHTSGKFTIILCPGEADQRIVHARVLKSDKEMDLALLLLDNPGQLKPLELGDVTTLYDTMELTAFGYPFGGALAFQSKEYPSISVSTGHVTSLRKKKGELELVQVDAVLNPGNSGGPVLDGKGHVVGIVQSGLPGSGINFAIPVSRLQKLLKGGVNTDLPPVAEPPPDLVDPTHGKNWVLTDYLKGSTLQIRELLNGEVERLAGKVKETELGITDNEKDAITDENAALNTLHQSAAFKQQLKEKKQAEQDLEAARKGGAAQDRLEASSRFNKTRFALEKMEKDAVAKCEPLSADHKRVWELQHQLKRFNESLEKATKWRSELLDATRNGFRMKGPIRAASRGILPKVVVEKVLGSDKALVTYDAPELLNRGKDQEGIQTFNAKIDKVKIMVEGVDTSTMKEGEPTNLDHVFVIVGKQVDAEGTVFNAERLPSDVDGLFDTIVPIRSPLTEKNGDLNKKAATTKVK